MLFTLVLDTLSFSSTRTSENLSRMSAVIGFILLFCQSALTTVSDTVKTGVISLVSKITAFAQMVVGTTVDTTRGSIEKMINFTETSIVNPIREMVDTTTSVISDTVQKVTDTTISKASQIFNTVTAVGGAVIDTAGDVFSIWRSLLRGVLKYWPIYVSIAAFIVFTAVFLYCCACYYIDQKRMNLIHGMFIKPIQVNKHKTNVIQEKKPKNAMVIP